MRIKNIKYSSILLLIACSLFMVIGCTKETELGGGDTALPEGSVRIMLANGNIDGGGEAAASNSGGANGANAAAATNSVHPGTKASIPPVSDDPTSENYVKKIQVFFYSEGKLECVREYVDGGSDNDIVWDGTSGLIVKRVTNLGKPKDIYVVTNWMDNLPNNIVPGSSINLLIKELTTLSADGLPFVPSKATPILMSGAVEGYVFHEPGQAAAKAATISLHRQMVKVEVKVLLDSKFYNTVSSDHTFGHAKLSVYNIPSQSFVLPIWERLFVPSSAAMFDLLNIEITNNSNTWSYMFYSYENPQTGTLPGDKVKSTYFNLNVPYTKTVDGVSKTHDNYYRVYIDDTRDGTNPHKTLRNHHYTVTVILAGFGTEKPTFDAIHASTIVTPWNSEDIEQELPGNDMTINKTEITELTHTTVDRSILVRSARPLDSNITPTIENVTYPVDMLSNAKNILINFDKKGDNGFGLSVSQNMASYKGVGKTTFYVVYGKFKKKITVGYHPAYTLATGHLIVANGILQISNDPNNLGSIFRYGSIVATNSDFTTQAPTEGGAGGAGVITPQSIQWEPLNKTYPSITGSWKTCWAKVPYWAGSGMPPQTVDNIRRGLGDPCRLVGLTKTQIDGGQVDNGTWKTPSYEQAQAIIATPGGRYGNGWKFSLGGSVFTSNYNRHIDGTCNAWLFDPSVAATGGPNNPANTSFWILHFPGSSGRVTTPSVLSYTKEYGYPIRCIRQ